jgi:ABC-type uncharacterized transport system fused permease/ATPase subunit
LVRVNEDIEGITISGDEADEKELLDRVFETALGVTRPVVGTVARLASVRSGYDRFTIAAPISVASKSYPSGKMTFRTVEGGGRRLQPACKPVCDGLWILADGVPHGGVQLVSKER